MRVGRSLTCHVRVEFELRSSDNQRQEVVTENGDVSYASPSEKRGRAARGLGQVTGTRSSWPEDGLLGTLYLWSTGNGPND
jgi:hypothetical protein